MFTWFISNVPSKNQLKMEQSISIAFKYVANEAEGPILMAVYVILEKNGYHPRNCSKTDNLNVTLKND